MKIGIRILGCPKNTADCEILAALLKKRGHELVKDAAQADLVLIDTCGFIEAAKRETIDTILDFVYYKKSRRDLKIAVKGCMVQRYYEELKKEIPEVDLWMGVLPPREVVKAIEKLKDNVKSPIPVYEDTDRFDLPSGGSLDRVRGRRVRGRGRCRMRSGSLSGVHTSVTTQRVMTRAPFGALCFFRRHARMRATRR